MTAAIVVRIENLDATLHMLTSMEGPELKKTLRKASAAGAKVYRDAIRGRLGTIPPHKPHKTKNGMRQAGALRRATRYRALRKETEYIGAIAAPMGRDASMRHLLEYGHNVKRTKDGPIVGQAGPEPVIAEAFESSEEAAYAAAERVIFAAIGD